MSRPFKPSAIPLRCTLCPKEPIFSDISHLLTHISSKGHLSHKFKLQIRGQTDPHARIELERYEIWYADNNLDELLAERLASKESKSTIKRMRTTSKAVCISHIFLHVGTKIANVSRVGSKTKAKGEDLNARGTNQA